MVLNERIRKRITILAVLLMASILLTVMYIHRNNDDEADYERVYTLYQIRYGDTAYGLASENKYPGMDSRDYIRELGEANSGINLFTEPLICGNYLLLVTYVPE